MWIIMAWQCKTTLMEVDPPQKTLLAIKMYLSRSKLTPSPLFHPPKNKKHSKIRSSITKSCVIFITGPSWCLSQCILTDTSYMTQQCGENMKFLCLNICYCIMCNSHQGNEWHRKSKNLNITLKPSELSIIPVSTYRLDLV